MATKKFHIYVYLNGVRVLVESTKGGVFYASVKGHKTMGPTRQAALLALAEKLNL